MTYASLLGSPFSSEMTDSLGLCQPLPLALQAVARSEHDSLPSPWMAPLNPSQRMLSGEARRAIAPQGALLASSLGGYLPKERRRRRSHSYSPWYPRNGLSRPPHRMKGCSLQVVSPFDVVPEQDLDFIRLRWWTVCWKCRCLFQLKLAYYSYY